jgi:multicomponent Na+:H+ antiporter subunit B
MTNHSEIISRMTGLLYPFILLFGFYIILNGHASPGGGFQGGAVLAAVFISRYLVEPDRCIRLKTLKTAEKTLFVCIILYPVLFLFPTTSNHSEFMNLCYLIVMNFLIGLKVCSGFTIVFFRFVFYEGGI